MSTIKVNKYIHEFNRLRGRNPIAAAILSMGMPVISNKEVDKSIRNRALYTNHINAVLYFNNHEIAEYPVYVSVIYGYVNILKVAIINGYHIPQDIMTVAIVFDNINILDELLKSGKLDIDEKLVSIFVKSNSVNKFRVVSKYVGDFCRFDSRNINITNSTTRGIITIMCNKGLNIVPLIGCLSITEKWLKLTATTCDINNVDTVDIYRLVWNCIENVYTHILRVIDNRRPTVYDIRHVNLAHIIGNMDMINYIISRINEGYLGLPEMDHQDIWWVDECIVRFIDLGMKLSPEITQVFIDNKCVGILNKLKSTEIDEEYIIIDP
jgi:hypothetical protein